MVSRMTLWRRSNPEKAKCATQRDYQRRQEGGYFKGYREKRVGLLMDQRLRRQVLELLGNECATCGFTDTRALQIDHIHGNGYRERQNIGVLKRYRLILEARGKGYQLLCANCNQIKKSVNREVRGNYKGR